MTKKNPINNFKQFKPHQRRTIVKYIISKPNEMIPKILVSIHCREKNTYKNS